MQFLTNNPMMTAGCLFCVYPFGMMFAGIYFGRMVERHGWPVVRWAKPREEGGEGQL